MHCIFHHKYQSGVFLAHQLYHGTDPKEQENIHIINSLHLKSKFAKKFFLMRPITSMQCLKINVSCLQLSAFQGHPS